MSRDTIKILLVDDDPMAHDYIGHYLKKEGFIFYSALNGIDALSMAQRIKPNLILLDLMIPGMDGIEICETLRKTENIERTSIIVLSARNEDYSQIASFDAGADDYITKPLKPKILINRILALLRRNQLSDYQMVKKSKNKVIIDYERYLVLLKGKEIYMPKKEFELLSFLHSDTHKVFTRNDIFSKIWSDKKVKIGQRTIDVHIRKLRKKIGLNHIKTVKGIGYKFVE